MNYELKVKEILKETYILIGKINNKELIKNLIEVVKKNKDENLSYKTHVKGHFTGFRSLVQNNQFIIQDAWGNICKRGEEVTEHAHADITGFCGVLYLTEGGPGTYFKEYNLLIEEEVGKYILFHPILKHSVKKIENDIERITIAFNMNETKAWENYSQVTWVNKK